MSSVVLEAPAVPAPAPKVRRLSAGARIGLIWEVVKGGFLELWSHKLRSMLTLTLLMLGVFALVVMTSVLDGILDKVGTGFAGMAWDGTAVVQAKQAQTSEEQKRFAMSPGFRTEDLPRLTVPHEKVLAFLPRATKRSSVRTPGGIERMFVTGLTPEYGRYMNRPIASGRGLADDDMKRRSTVAVVGATLGAKLFGGADPVGRDIVVEGVPYRIVGLQDRIQIFNEEMYLDANGIQIPLETYIDRMDPSHKLTSVAVKLARKSDLTEVSFGRVTSQLMIGSGSATARNTSPSPRADCYLVPPNGFRRQDRAEHPSDRWRAAGRLPLGADAALCRALGCS